MAKQTPRFADIACAGIPGRGVRMFHYLRLKDCREDKDLSQALLYNTSLDYLAGLTNNPMPYEHSPFAILSRILSI